MEQPYILVAEDERVIGCDLRETMQEAGYEVDGPFPAISGAMLSYQRRRPDLAILDVKLTDGASYALAEKMLEENVPVIFYSGKVAGADLAKRFPNSVTLDKPSPPSEVIAQVRSVLGRFD